MPDWILSSLLSEILITKFLINRVIYGPQITGQSKETIKESKTSKENALKQSSNLKPIVYLLMDSPDVGDVPNIRSSAMDFSFSASLK